MEERRRYSRRSVECELATVPSVLDVRVLDISVAGVLLQSSHRVEAGARGRLRLNLDGIPFTADLHVRRVLATADPRTGYRLGATFVDLSPDVRHLIERFMTQ
jgi:hypothetical protein